MAEITGPEWQALNGLLSKLRRWKRDHCYRWFACAPACVGERHEADETLSALEKLVALASNSDAEPARGDLAELKAERDYWKAMHEAAVASAGGVYAERDEARAECARWVARIKLLEARAEDAARVLLGRSER